MSRADGACWLQVYREAKLGARPTDAMDLVEEEEEEEAVAPEAELESTEQGVDGEAAAVEEEEASEEEELTAENIGAMATEAADAARLAAERPIEPIAEPEGRWDSEGALGLDGRVEAMASRLGEMQNRTGRVRNAPRWRSLDK